MSLHLNNGNIHIDSLSCPVGGFSCNKLVRSRGIKPRHISICTLLGPVRGQNHVLRLGVFCGVTETSEITMQRVEFPEGDLAAVPVSFPCRLSRPPDSVTNWKNKAIGCGSCRAVGLEFPDLQDGGRLGPIPLASASWRHPVTSAAADRGFAQPTQKKKRPIEI
jgi:hypothetical protein